MIPWRRWKFLPNFAWPTLGPMNSDGEPVARTWAKKSNNNLTTRSYPKLCSDAGLKTFQRGQCFITLYKEGPARGWIRKNTKIGPVWNIHVCHHEDRYSIEIQVRSLFQDRTSWVRNFNGIEKYVKETTETTEDEEHRASGKPIAKARLRMKSSIKLTPVSVTLRERKWVEVNPGSRDLECYVISKAMIRLLRHDQTIPRETDGAVKFDDIVEEFKKKFEGAWQWSLNDWISILAKGGGDKVKESILFEP